MAHRWNIPFIRIFFDLLLLWACQPVGPTNPFDPKSPETVQALAGIRGEVVSVETGQPISEALVKVYELSEEASNVCGVSSDDMEADASSDDASSVAESTTNELGRFQIPGLSKGTYTLCVSHAQFAPLRRSGIRLAIGQKLTLSEPLALMVGTGTVSAQIELDNLEIDSALGQAVVRAVSVLLTPINSESSGSMVGRPDEFGRLTFVKVLSVNGEFVLTIQITGLWWKKLNLRDRRRGCCSGGCCPFHWKLIRDHRRSGCFA